MLIFLSMAVVVVIKLDDHVGHRQRKDIIAVDTDWVRVFVFGFPDLLYERDHGIFRDDVSEYVGGCQCRAVH